MENKIKIIRFEGRVRVECGDETVSVLFGEPKAVTVLASDSVSFASINHAGAQINANEIRELLEMKCALQVLQRFD